MAQRLRDGNRRVASRCPGHRCRRRADRHRDGRRAGRAGPQRHAGLRRDARSVAVRAGRRSVAKWLRKHGRRRARGRRGGRGPAGRGASSPTVRCARARSPSGRPVSACRTWRAASGLHTDALGRLLTDETLTSVDDDRIVAAGDAAAPSGQPLRMSCQAAVPLGAQAANTVLSRIAGTEPAVIDQAFLGSNASAWAGAPPSSSWPARTTHR